MAQPTVFDPSDDIADLARQLLAALAGIHVHILESLPEGSVVVARRLLPSDTVVLSRRRTSAVVLEHAGPTSHAALLARALGIPAARAGARHHRTGPPWRGAPRRWVRRRGACRSRRGRS